MNDDATKETVEVVVTGVFNDHEDGESLTTTDGHLDLISLAAKCGCNIYDTFDMHVFDRDEASLRQIENPEPLFEGADIERIDRFRQGYDRREPQAYKVRITMEVVPLNDDENAAWWSERRRRTGW